MEILYPFIRGIWLNERYMATDSEKTFKIG